MNRTLTKSIVVLVALVLCASCIGSAFALYRVNATSKTVNLSAAAPDPYYLESDWGGWVADNTTKMAYNAGVYVTNDVTVKAGQGFKVFGSDWITAIDSISVPYGGGGDSNITLTNGGIYDFTYSPSNGISVTADVMYYTFKCPDWVDDASAVIRIWVWGGTDASQFYDLNPSYTEGGYIYYTWAISTDNTYYCINRHNPDLSERWNHTLDAALGNGILEPNWTNG